MDDDIKFAVALLVGRDLGAPSECCKAGEICRAEVRKVVGLKGKPIVFEPSKLDTEDEADKMWVRLINTGMRGVDYGRVLVLPGNSVSPYARRQERDEETILRWQADVNAIRKANGLPPC